MIVAHSDSCMYKRLLHGKGDPRGDRKRERKGDVYVHFKINSRVWRKTARATRRMGRNGTRVTCIAVGLSCICFSRRQRYMDIFFLSLCLSRIQTAARNASTRSDTWRAVDVARAIRSRRRDIPR